MKRIGNAYNGPNDECEKTLDQEEPKPSGLAINTTHLEDGCSKKI
jgi:hypothetical protein